MSLFGGVEVTGRPDLENIRRLDLLPVPMVRRMQRYGIAIDIPYLKDFSAELGTQMTALEREIASHLPADRLRAFSEAAAEVEGELGPAAFNANSAVQIRSLLFETLKVGTGRDLKTTADGAVSTGKKQLELCRDDHPVVHKVLEYRERSKLKSAFADSLPAKARFHPRNSDGSCPVCELPHVDSTWRVHTEFPMTRTETGRFASRNPNCFDGKTEILTNIGWIRFDRYKNQHGSVKVAQWEECGCISFVNPSAFIESETDTLLRYSNQHIDLCISPDHRCLVRDRKTKALRVVNGWNYPSDAQQICAGEWVGGYGIQLSDAEIRLLVALQADASFSENGRVDLSVTKTRKDDRLVALLQECGIEFARKKDERRVRFYFHAPKCFKLLGREKRYGPYLLEFNRRQINVFLSEIMFWDGCWTRQNHYSTTVKTNADWVQILYTLSGKRAKVREYIQTYDERGIWAWNVDVTGRDYSLTTNIQRSGELINEKVYCVSVPSSYIVVRRNGCVMITGNCQQIPTRSELGAKIRAGFVASPGTKLVSSDFSQIELRDLAHCAQAHSMIQAYREDKDIHLYSACRVFGLDYDHYAQLAELKEQGTLSPAQKIDWSDFALYKRLPTKNVNFMIVYGATAIGLQAQLALSKLFWTEEECNDFIERWFGLYPEVRDYMELQHYRARRYGYVWDLFGRVRRVPETYSTHPYIRSQGLRQAGNMPIQSTSAGQTKLAMGALEEDFTNIYSDGAGPWVWPLLTIHDQLMAEADEDSADDVRDIMMHRFSAVMCDEATGEHLFRVPVKSDGEILERWKKE